MSNKEIAQAKNDCLSMAMSANEIVQQVKLIQDVMASVMKKDEHYGVIPGTRKPTLYKPGAEKLCLLFRLCPEFQTTETYDGRHLTVKSRCVLIHVPSGKAMGSGEAICSTKEKKYRYRKDGGKVVENGELEDCYNTIIKMANKRALVAATLVATAASDIFTQDMEDLPVVIVEAQATVKTPAAEIVGKADEKHAEKKANGYMPETASEPPADAEQLDSWRGRIDAIRPEELPGGRKCWTLIGHDGLEFKTIEEIHSKVKPKNGDVIIRYKKNAKGNLVAKTVGEVG